MHIEEIACIFPELVIKPAPDHTSIYCYSFYQILTNKHDSIQCMLLMCMFGIVG